MWDVRLHERMLLLVPSVSTTWMTLLSLSYCGRPIDVNLQHDVGGGAGGAGGAGAGAGGGGDDVLNSRDVSAAWRKNGNGLAALTFS
jgi:hypothetical protein